MKQIMIAVVLLAIALALVLGVIVPIMEHGAQTGEGAVSAAGSISGQMRRLLR